MRLTVSPRFDCEKAHSFETFICGDPECGLHVVPRRRDGLPICEMVVGREGIHGLLRYIHDEGLDLP